MPITPVQSTGPGPGRGDARRGAQTANRNTPPRHEPGERRMRLSRRAIRPDGGPGTPGRHYGAANPVRKTGDTGSSSWRIQQHVSENAARSPAPRAEKSNAGRASEDRECNSEGQNRLVRKLVAASGLRSEIDAAPQGGTSSRKYLVGPRKPHRARIAPCTCR